MKGGGGLSSTPEQLGMRPRWPDSRTAPNQNDIIVSTWGLPAILETSREAVLRRSWGEVRTVMRSHRCTQAYERCTAQIQLNAGSGTL